MPATPVEYDPISEYEVHVVVEAPINAMSELTSPETIKAASLHAQRVLPGAGYSSVVDKYALDRAGKEIPDEEILRRMKSGDGPVLWRAKLKFLARP